MKIEIRKKTAKLLKKLLKDKVYHYESGNMRCDYKITSVIHSKRTYDHMYHEFKLKVEVISTEKRYMKWDDNLVRVRDENGEFVYYWRKFYADKTHAHRYNNGLRRDAIDKMEMKALGLMSCDFEDALIKWN